MKKVKIDGKEYQVDDQVGEYIVNMKTSLKDTAEAVVKAKEEALAEVKAEQDKEALIVKLKDSHITLTGDESMEVLTALGKAVDEIKPQARPNFKDAGVKIDNIDDLIAGITVEV